MTQNTYRWGILGAGKIAHKFCTALNFTPRASVYAIASRNKDNAQAFATTHSATQVYTNYADLVNDPLVDIVYIATPHAFHYEHTLLCLAHNKAVLCEKPLSLTYEQSATMTQLAVSKKLFLMEGMWTRFMPFIEKIASILQQGIIGTPQLVRAEFGFAAPAIPDGRLYNKLLGGGSVLDIGIYPIFLATHILGTPTNIYACTHPTSTGVDGSANILLQYENGASAQLYSSILVQNANEAEIVGTKGRIKISSMWHAATQITLVLNNGSQEIFDFPHACNGFEYEIEEVMQCLDKQLIESTRMPHSFTLTMATIMDAVLDTMPKNEGAAK